MDDEDDEPVREEQSNLESRGDRLNIGNVAVGAGVPLEHRDAVRDGYGATFQNLDLPTPSVPLGSSSFRAAARMAAPAIATLTGLGAYRRRVVANGWTNRRG
jgi:hypothetical protein